MKLGYIDLGRYAGTYGGYIVGSAYIAKNRLFGVIKADRAAVPCGRWVKVEPVPYGLVLQAWGMQRWLCGGWSSMPPPPKPMPSRQRYRWSERR